MTKSLKAWADRKQEDVPRGIKTKVAINESSTRSGRVIARAGAERQRAEGKGKTHA